jgi:hypothetical protein
MYEFVLWRIVNGHWKIIKPVYSIDYPCCASRERVLPIGQRPHKIS